MKEKCVYKFNGTDGDFSVENADSDNQYYFPIANEEGFLASITPRLHGDAKMDQHTFLTPPVSIEDLHAQETGRNFWFQFGSGKAPVLWAVNGQSVWQKAGVYGPESCSLKAGFLWHQVTRSNKKLGVEAEILNFVPASSGTFEIMRVRLKNTGKKKLTAIPTSAVPLYARSADNLRDHRHVTSLLHRVKKVKGGMEIKPTMTFNERGHKLNKVTYFAVGFDGKGKAPTGFFPTWDLFFGEGGSADKPAALVNQFKALSECGDEVQGKEAMGGLRFENVSLAPGKTAEFFVFLGIDPKGGLSQKALSGFGAPAKVEGLLQKTKDRWLEINNLIRFESGDPHFNQWMRWVVSQPTFRKVYGCSFLPDFDYGRGGRGWRDLWQDCLALLLANPKDVRAMVLSNFKGVRIDGSNATIIGRKAEARKNADGTYYWEPEFIADRNNVTRTWMDHGVWPFLTTRLYIDQTGDFDILEESASYFRDAQLKRAKELDSEWIRNRKEGDESQNLLKTQDDDVYEGSILEHILVQTLVQFFNVGEHNNILLEDADWNDGMDMGHKKGESVAFTHIYAGNLNNLADLLELAQSKGALTEAALAEEILLLLDRVSNKVNYDSVEEKRSRLEEYFSATLKRVKGQQTTIPVATLVQDLRDKAAWMKKHLNEKEWIEADGLGWFNGYYNNEGERVEGKTPSGNIQMTLTGQVFPLMADTAPLDRVKKVVQAVNEVLWDHELGGIRLNSDFGDIRLDLGRAFSFSFGEKENGAIFSHMVVMYANALYHRGLVEEGNRAILSLYRLAKNSVRSRIFPGLPEYFNNEGRGRYHFLTGSASWFVLTMLTEVFGVRGFGGDLLLSPKLTADQLDKKGSASVQCRFAGARLRVTVENPEKVPFENAVIAHVYGNGSELPFTRRADGEVLIQRELLSSSPEWTLRVLIKRK